jgi:hypothetical protein
LNHITTIRLTIIIVAATLMIAGTIFYPMVRKEQQAYSVSSVRHQVKSEENAARSSLQQRGQQHMDQGNLCLRTSGKCSNSNVGEQTLGNDNSVTGFADPSKNVQQRTAEPSTSTPTPTPTTSGGQGGNGSPGSSSTFATCASTPIGGVSCGAAAAASGAGGGGAGGPAGGGGGSGGGGGAVATCAVTGTPCPAASAPGGAGAAGGAGGTVTVNR